MFIKDGKRFNIEAPFTDGNKSFPNMRDPYWHPFYNITQIPDPVRGDDRFYFVNESNEAPYVINTPKNLESVRSYWWNMIKTYRDDLTRNGGCFVSGKWFHSDTDSKQQQMALAIIGAGLPVGKQWKTMDGSFITMTQQLAADIFTAQIARELSIFENAETLKASMAAMTFEQLVQFDITAGWPDRYTES